MPVGDEFKCDACGEFFAKAWSDEEAALERRENFPWLRKEDAVTVCDGCYRRIMGLPAAEAQS
jgi:hypothetical protein